MINEVDSVLIALMNWSTPLTELFWKQLNLFNEDNNQSQIRSYVIFLYPIVISVNSGYIQPSELGTIWHLTAYDDVNDVRDHPTSHANCCFLISKSCRFTLQGEAGETGPPGSPGPQGPPGPPGRSDRRPRRSVVSISCFWRTDHL